MPEGKMRLVRVAASDGLRRLARVLIWFTLTAYISLKEEKHAKATFSESR